MLCLGDRPIEGGSLLMPLQRKGGICSISSGYSATMAKCFAVASISSRIACARTSPVLNSPCVQALGPLICGQ